MARCHHDKQDFKSDLIIEVARECDLLREENDLDEFQCDKNPGHSGFIPFKDLTVEHLPHKDGRREILESIKTWGSYVVRLVVDKVRNGRWVKEVGTGYVVKEGDKYCIQSNNHVVKNDDEVKKCTVEFFYDSNDRSNPISSNIRELSSIEVHIDEDDGKGKVISGVMAKFREEYVVRISESIFQDKVKKCKLLWDGEVIARGTRLFFQPMKPKEFFSDMSKIDLELYMQHTSPDIWLFDFHPLPKSVVHIQEMVKNYKSIADIMYCIGHPHGGIKMVTFGRLLGKSFERFDIQGRRIAQPEKDCKCKEVACTKYSCKTCPGSSGSLVFLAQKVVDMSRGISHFMGERVKALLPNGELVENINMAWG
ncbi:hypothetical protein LOTGIDRAFT_158731 [Lottia gigantea]|uniref:Uncharacterized protein n=1 Tax=Lottia gigantea TaxID=225164 RepID=V4AUY4_LOTGI|nr:hypothetical protein LOTGIDRAFT_158731 [Lottia gigantea]ESO98785.1 hypothetical protein LOTGIDRAFT_158731 [Lottia gigantea]